jgi:REP element-mobilizing transposase RayT
MNEIQKQKKFYSPKKPNFHRRAKWHNYQQPSIYMITIRRNPKLPALSIVGPVPTANQPAANGPAVPYTASLTDLGQIVKENLFQIENYSPEVKIGRFIIMPDHLHFILYVCQPLQRPFSDIIMNFKGACSREFWHKYPRHLLTTAKESFFEKNYNDRILYSQGQLDAMNAYILDNPRRYAIKSQFPDLFSSVNHIVIDGVEYAAYGNIFLLRHVEKEPVIIRSHYTPEQRSELRVKWRRVIDNCGVLISPFISQSEHDVKIEALETGGNVIEILDNGFPERFKPAGKAFDACKNGHLLYIAPVEFSSEKIQLTRERAWAMNHLAMKICALTADQLLVIRRGLSLRSNR